MFVLFIECKNCMTTIVNRKADFFYKTNIFESIRIANWNALTRTTVGDRSFAVAGPRVWNSLTGYYKTDLQLRTV